LINFVVIAYQLLVTQLYKHPTLIVCVNVVFGCHGITAKHHHVRLVVRRCIRVCTK